MWDKPEALSTLANFCYGLAAAGLLYLVILTTVHLPVFAVRHVQVSGSVSRVTEAQVSNVVHRELRGNFFTINLDDSRAAFEKLPWVRKVQVRRDWPDRLQVTLEEHAALARWGDEGLVNTHGEIFMAASDEDLPVFTGPPELSGEITSSYATFRQTLLGIGKDVAAIHVSDRRAWTLVLDDGMRLELGREHMIERLAKFADVYGTTLAQMPRQPRLVDLRYPNGFAVRLGVGQDGV